MHAPCNLLVELAGPENLKEAFLSTSLSEALEDTETLTIKNYTFMFHHTPIRVQVANFKLSGHPTPTMPYRPSISKTVLLLIDAASTDFSTALTPWLHSLNGAQRVFIALTQLPEAERIIGQAKQEKLQQLKDAVKLANPLDTLTAYSRIIDLSFDSSIDDVLKKIHSYAEASSSSSSSSTPMRTALQVNRDERREANETQAGKKGDRSCSIQ
ncbi:MAG: hypothetical protein K0R66_499 [Gammaproteobacteria bacterium]|jgi:hypothetical protein|nr:hypothetical protein [Gammaproteobacteria bacterium]